MEMDSIETIEADENFEMGVDVDFDAEIEMAASQRSRKKKKGAILFDILNLEPLLIGTISKAIVDGRSMQDIRAVFISRLAENPEMVKKHGGDHPMKVWHPEFLTAVQTVLETRLSKLQTEGLKNQVASALKIMAERSEEARALREVARRKKEAGEKPARRKKKKD